MRSNFITYLEYAAQQAKKVEPPNKYFLPEWIDSLKRKLKTQPIEKIELNFENFPLKMKDDEISPFDKESIIDFAIKFHLILTQGRQIKVDKNNCYSPSERKQLEVKHFVDCLFMSTCQEILDEQCRIKPEIIDILALHFLPSACFDGVDEEHVSLTCKYLATAYFTSILLRGIKNYWNETFKETYYKSKREPANYPDIMLGFIKQTHQADATRSQIDKILSFPIFGRSVRQSCADIFIEMPIDNIAAILEQDFKPLSPEQQKLIPKKLKDNWNNDKIQFWAEILRLYTAEQSRCFESEKEDLMLRKSEHPEDKDIQVVYQQKQESYEKKIKEFTDLINKKLGELTGSKISFNIFSITKNKEKKPPESFVFANNETLYRWFLVRNNLVLIETITAEMQAAEKANSKIFEYDNGVAEAIKKSKTKIALMAYETKALLLLFVCKCQPYTKLKTLLETYQNFLGTLTTFSEMSRENSINSKSVRFNQD